MSVEVPNKTFSPEDDPLKATSEVTEKAKNSIDSLFSKNRRLEGYFDDEKDIKGSMGLAGKGSEMAEGLNNIPGYGQEEELEVDKPIIEQAPISKSPLALLEAAKFEKEFLEKLKIKQISQGVDSKSRQFTQLELDKVNNEIRKLEEELAEAEATSEMEATDRIQREEDLEEELAPPKKRTPLKKAWEVGLERHGISSVIDTSPEEELADRIKAEKMDTGEKELENKEEITVTSIPEELTSGKLLTISKIEDGEETGVLFGQSMNGLIEVGKPIELAHGHSTEVIGITKDEDLYIIKTISGSIYRFDPSKSTKVWLAAETPPIVDRVVEDLKKSPKPEPETIKSALENREDEGNNREAIEDMLQEGKTPELISFRDGTPGFVHIEKDPYMIPVGDIELNKEEQEVIDVCEGLSNLKRQILDMRARLNGEVRSSRKGWKCFTKIMKRKSLKHSMIRLAEIRGILEEWDRSMRTTIYGYVAEGKTISSDEHNILTEGMQGEIKKIASEIVELGQAV